MRSRDLGPPAAIDEFQAADGAALIIGAKDDASEDAIPHDPRRQIAYAFLALLERKGSPFFAESVRRQIRMVSGWLMLSGGAVLAAICSLRPGWFRCRDKNAQGSPVRVAIPVIV